MSVQAEANEPMIVNGINVDDLKGLIAGVEQDAGNAKTHWHVATTWQGQTQP